MAKFDGTSLDLGPGVTVEFCGSNGAKCATDYPLGKAALAILQSCGSLPLSFGRLHGRAISNLQSRGITANQASEGDLAGFLLELYAAGIVEFRTHLPPIAETISQHPVASPLVRWQVRRGNIVTSQHHLAVKVEDEIGRRLLASLDGTRTPSELVDELWPPVASETTSGGWAGNGGERRQNLENELSANLAKLASLGLLVG